VKLHAISSGSVDPDFDVVDISGIAHDIETYGVVQLDNLASEEDRRAWAERKARRDAEARSPPICPSSLWTGDKAVLYVNVRNVLPDLTVAEFEDMWVRSNGATRKLQP
jgi:hypothetical protein